jgi:HK97 family phage major capsid protein
MSISKRQLDDLPGLSNLLDEETRYMIRLLEEAQYLKGDGTGQNMLGIFPQATAASYTPAVGDTLIDLIKRDIDELVDASYPVDAVLIRASRWTDIELEKDTTGRYLLGDPNVIRRPTLWGVDILTNVNITVDQMLVGAFAFGAVIRDRGPIEVEFSNSNKDDFEKNLVSARAEVDTAIVVRRPLAFNKRTSLVIPTV